MNKKKLLLLVTLSELGGAQKVVYHLAAELEPKKFEITVACAPGGELVDWLKKCSIEVIELPCFKRAISPLNDVSCLFEVYRLIKSGGYDIVHCHSTKAGILGRLAAFLAGVRQVYFTVHGWVIDEKQRLPVRLMYTLAEHVAGRVSTRVICVSRYDLEKAQKLRLVSSEKLLLINNGVPDIYSPVINKGAVYEGLRSELGLSGDTVIIGTVMRLAAPKLPLFFLEVAAALQDSRDGLLPGSDYHFVVIGDGPLMSQCEDYAASHNLNGNVSFLGVREDAAELVAGFSVFTLFSGHEGLPLTIIEAMLAGVPVVASNVGGVAEMVVHGESGYIVEGMKKDLAAGYIAEIVKNPALCAQMGAAGRNRALSVFSLEKMVECYEELYSGTL